jgi:hypothetical protein
MLALRPQVRYSLRAAALFVVMLALWWLALRTPMLFLLRATESVALSLLANSNSTEPIEVDPSGDWNFRVPVEDTNGAVKFRAIEFTMSRPDLVLFTFSVPVFWAMVLAAPLGRSGIRALLWGTALVSLIEVVALLAQVEMTAYGAAAELHLSANGLAEWSRNFGSRLVVGVVPFAAPVLAAVGLHRELRSQIFTYSVPGTSTPRA